MSKSLAISYAMKKKAKKMAEGGDVGGAKTSTAGNKTKTGGSNPGGASTGGAGTVTITTGKNPPKAINISNIGGKTDSRNAGGMDPSDEDDAMMMAEGGPVKNPKDDVPDPDKKKSAEFQKGMSASPDYMANLKKGLGFARGGKVDGYQSPSSKIHQTHPDLDHELDMESGYKNHIGNEVQYNEEAIAMDDMVSRIMEGRANFMSKGGKVANKSHMHADELPNEFDDLALRDDLEFAYNGKNSGDHLSDEQEDHDRKDIISRIMRSRAKKDRLPNPR